MSYPVRILQVIYTLYAFAIFVLLLIILFPFVVLASFFGKVKGGNRIYDLCRFWADAAFLLWGIRHRNLYKVPHDLSKPMVFVFNHVSYMDIPIIMKTFRKQHIRVLGKAEMAKIPLFGFVYREAAVLVDRSSPGARAKSVAQLVSIIKKNISVVIAPEGTFNMGDKPLKSFYDGAFRIAIETNTPIKPVIFLDAYDRLHHRSIFTLTPGKSRSVFLEEVEVAGLNIGDAEDLKHRVFKIMESALIEYKASWTKQTG